MTSLSLLMTKSRVDDASPKERRNLTTTNERISLTMTNEVQNHKKGFFKPPHFDCHQCLDHHDRRLSTLFSQK